MTKYTKSYYEKPLYKKILKQNQNAQPLGVKMSKFRKILKISGRKYLARTKGKVKVSDDRNYEDWLHQCLKQEGFKKSKLDFLIKTVCNSLHLLITFQSSLCFVFENIVVDITRSR